MVSAESERWASSCDERTGWSGRHLATGLDPIADAMDRGDVEAWQKLPVRLIGEASMYRDIRANYRAAVQAGVIPDDRGPHAA